LSDALELTKHPTICEGKVRLKLFIQDPDKKKTVEVTEDVKAFQKKFGK
jgi:hypothetical protein